MGRGGRRQGDPKDLPPPPKFAEGWKLGPPDLILMASEDFKVPASGPDLYRCFVIPINLAKDMYISAIDFQPGNRQVVHHVMTFIDTSGEGRKRDAADPGLGYTSYIGPGIALFEQLCFWNMGHDVSHFPLGVGQRLPSQSDVILQVHYHPNGKAGVDRTRVGLYFSRTPVKQSLHWNSASNFEFRLPPGQSDIEVIGRWYVPADLEVLAVSPHMHQLGSDMRISVKYPDGKNIDLINIPDWDPSWQNTYYFQQPIPLPQGSVVKTVAHFDNSDHARNPHQPPKTVKWGHGINDEMCDGFLAVVKKGQDLVKHPEIDDLADIFARQRLRNWQRANAKGKSSR